MSLGLQTAAYIAATILFILALGGLSNQESAKRAVWYGIVGMALAVFATILGPQVPIGIWLVLMLVVGAGVGTVLALRVEMTGMPQLVALLHSFVGMAAVLIGINSNLETSTLIGAEKVIHEAEVFVGVFIGAVTFTGSLIAYGKLAGQLSGKALVLPFRHLLNLAGLVISILLMIAFMQGWGSWTLYLMMLIAFALGAHLVLAIGGADMPVVVAMLNSYSGWAAAATGLPARQRPADRHRGAGGLVRRDPVLHHVQGDEPAFPERDPRRLRRRQGAGAWPSRARWWRSTPMAWRRC